MALSITLDVEPARSYRRPYAGSFIGAAKQMGKKPENRTACARPKRRAIGCLVGLVVPCVFGLGSTVRAADVREWRVTEGTATFQLYGPGLDGLGIELQSDCAHDGGVASDSWGIVESVMPGSTVMVDVSSGDVQLVTADLEFTAGLAAMGNGRTLGIDEMRIVTHFDSMVRELMISEKTRPWNPALVVADYETRLNYNTRQLVITSESVGLSTEWAKAFGVVDYRNTPLARIMIELSVEAVDPMNPGFPSPAVYASAQPEDFGSVAAATSGPDVTVFAISGTVAYGCGPVVANPDNGNALECQRDPETGSYISGFAIGTISCNVGDQNLVWDANTNQHPVIGQNMFRLKNNRFEQIGMAWVKHGFFATDSNHCADCTDDDNSVPGTFLAVACSDLYSASLNGNWRYLGPKSDINAHTGYNPGPVPVIGNPPPLHHTVERRLQVYNDDLYPLANVNAKYFVEGHYVTPDDAAAGNDDNNIAYKPVSVLQTGDEAFVLAEGGPPSVSEQPAIRAWAANDHTVLLTDARVPGEGLFVVGAKSIELTDGFFRYEYAVFNMNSDRSGGSFTVPLPDGASVRNAGFHDVFYHDGEPYDGTDWPAVVVPGGITWATDPYEVNANANALRWSTLYNFWFEVNVPPFGTEVTLGLFKPGVPESITVETWGPRPGLIDCNGNEIADTCDVSCSGLGCVEPFCGTSRDCNGNMIPDECTEYDKDCNDNGIPDNCDLNWETGVICDCDGPSGTSEDCDRNLIPDECDPDCDGDGIPDECELVRDTDGDGWDDCDDPCPLTTPPGFCDCTPQCCCNAGQICFPGFTPDQCLALGADCAPVCQVEKCRHGCLLGDGDGDGDVDLADAGQFWRCFSGPSATVGFVAPGAGCLQAFDFDNDGDVDKRDYFVNTTGERHLFYDAFSGP